MAVLAALLLLSVSRGLSWGLPGLGEEATPLRKSIEFWGASSGSFTLNPRFYNYPHLSFYVQWVVQAVMYLVGIAGGAWSGLNEFRAALVADLPQFVMAARWTTAVIAAATVYPVWRIGRRLGGAGGGMAAAVLLAANPVFAAQARFIGTDIPLAFAGSMALACILDTLDHGPGPFNGDPARYRARLGSIRRAAVWVGLAASCKYPGAWLMVPLAASLAVTKSSRRDWGQALLFAFLAFAATSPFVIFDLPDAVSAVAFERHHMSTGHFGTSRELALIRYVTDVLPRAFAWPGLVAVLAALVFLLVRGGRAARITVLFALTGLLFIGSWRVSADRYILLVLPVLVALVGGLFGRARPAPVLGVGLALLMALPSAGRLWREGEWRSLPTTQSAASAWAIENIPRGALTAAERYSIESAADSLTLFLIPFDSVHPHLYDPAYSLPYYAPFEYVVLSGAQYNRYLDQPREYPAQAAFYDGIARDFDEVAGFESGSGLTGSPIRIFRRREGTGTTDFRSISGDFYNRIENPGPIARFLTSLGATFSRAGREDLALAAAEHAVALAPDDPMSLSNLASLRARRGEYLPALKGYQRALQIAPDDPILHYNVGRLYQGKELWSEALAAYARAMAANPRLSEAYLASAICHIQMGRNAAARASLRDFLERFPTDPRASQARAMLRELDGLR